jgi:cob(I)alamin adenosyltransferase
MKIYTRTGDAGETSLFSGGRVRKDDIRVEAYGTVDELVSLLGLLSCEPLPPGAAERLLHIQSTLFEVGSALADPERRIAHAAVAWTTESVEAWIDEMDAQLEPLRSFILPGGSRAAALAHVVRTVCRRAERRVNALENTPGGIPEGLISYLNRLSDALFVLARFINADQHIEERVWRSRTAGDRTRERE